MVSEMRYPEVAVAVSPRFGQSKVAKSDEKWAWHMPGKFGNIDVRLKVTARACLGKWAKVHLKGPQYRGCLRPRGFKPDPYRSLSLLATNPRSYSAILSL